MEGEIYNAFNGMLNDDDKFFNVFCNSEFLIRNIENNVFLRAILNFVF